MFVAEASASSRESSITHTVRAAPDMRRLSMCWPMSDARLRSAYDTRTELDSSAWLTVGVTNAKATVSAANAVMVFNMSRLLCATRERLGNVRGFAPASRNGDGLVGRRNRAPLDGQ